MSSMRETIYNSLKDAGLTVYLPGQVQGKCTAPYCIVTDAGTIQTGRATGRRVYIITGCVPESRPLDLRVLMGQIRTALIANKHIRADGGVSEEHFDEDHEAICAAIEYSALCAI